MGTSKFLYPLASNHAFCIVQIMTWSHAQEWLVAEQKEQNIGCGECSLTLWNSLVHNLAKQKQAHSSVSFNWLRSAACYCLHLPLLLCSLFWYQHFKKHTQIDLWCYFHWFYMAGTSLCKFWQIPVSVCWPRQEQAATSLPASLESLLQAPHTLLVILTRSVESILPQIWYSASCFSVGWSPTL